jgi:hypothetical protein
MNPIELFQDHCPGKPPVESAYQCPARNRGVGRACHMGTQGAFGVNVRVRAGGSVRGARMRASCLVEAACTRTLFRAHRFACARARGKVSGAHAARF